MISETAYIHQSKAEIEHHYQTIPLYNISLFEGKGSINIDFTDYNFSGNIALFSTPYQLVRIIADAPIKVRTLQFHGDFYCIEYHKKRSLVMVFCLITSIQSHLYSLQKKTLMKCICYSTSWQQS